MARSGALTATSLAAIFDMEPSPRSNGIPLAALHDARHVKLCSQLGQWKSYALVVDDRPAERLAFGGVAGGIFQRSPRDADRLGGDHWASLLEGAQSSRAGTLCAGDDLSRLGEFVFELFLPAQQIGLGNTYPV